MNQVKKLLSRLRPQDPLQLQKIRDEAAARYENKFYLLLTEIEYLNEIELDEEVLAYANKHLPLLLQEIDDLFNTCKTACNKAAPHTLRKDLEHLSKSNKYAYAQTCKSLKTIEACIQFNTLYSMFESRLHALNRKLDKQTPSRKTKTTTRRSSKKPGTRTRSIRRSSVKQINREAVRQFQTHYDEFLSN